MFLVVLNRGLALGNGHRKQGVCLAEVDGVDPDQLVAAAMDLVGADRRDVSKLPGTVTPAEGVDGCEVITALRNARLVSFVDSAPVAPEAIAAEASSSPDPADADPDAGPPADKPTRTKKAAEPKPKRPRK